MLVDSHCHLQLIDYKALGLTLDEVVHAALDQKIQHLLCVATNLEQHAELINLAERYSMVTVSLGVHPNERVAVEPSVESLLELQQHDQIVAIGETGLDFYRDTVSADVQRERFARQIEVAKQAGKPLIIHSREAKQEIIALLKSEHASEVGGVFHCFVDDWETAKQALDLNFLISFSGIVTFNNAKDLQAVALKVPLDKMLVETDSPYLAPVPMRGKINQPAFVRYTAEFLANLKGVALEELARQTTDNYFMLFG